jgi:hypothetical protein
MTNIIACPREEDSDLFPKHQETLDFLNLQKGPIKEAKIIWGLRSGKYHLVRHIIKSNLTKIFITVSDKPDLQGIRDPDIKNVLNLRSLSEVESVLKGSHKSFKLMGSNLGGIFVLDFDWMTGVENPVEFYSSIKEYLEIVTYKKDLTAYLVFIGSLSDSGKTKQIFNNVGLEQINPTWEVNPNISRHYSAGEAKNDFASFMRDYACTFI